VKLTAKANALAVAARAAASAVDDKTAKRNPILGALLIDATAGLKFIGTDLDTAITATCAATIIEAGRVAASSEALARLFVSMAADVDVEIETVDSGLQIKTGRSRYLLPTLLPENFPSAPATDSTTEMVLTRDEARHLFADTSFCMNSEGTRFYLRGVFLHLDDCGRLQAAATDGHRLAQASSAIVQPPHALPANGTSAGVIVPIKAINLISKLKTADIVLRTDAKAIEIRTGNLLIASKLIDGVFPDYRRIIPAESNNIAKLGREALLATLKRLRVARDAAEQDINVTLAWKKGAKAIRLAIADGEIGEDIVAAETTGAAQITLSIAQMVVMTGEIEAEKLQLDVAGKLDPVRIVAGKNLLCVLAPCTR
jgi:DNA polymerase-3 subunit beta